MDLNKIYFLLNKGNYNKNFVKTVKVKPIKNDLKTKEIINKGKIELFIGKILLNKSAVDLRKNELKAGLQKLDNINKIKDICELQDNLIEGHVHVIAKLGFLMAIMNFSSKEYNSSIFLDNANIYSGNVKVNKGMSLTRVISADNKDYNNKLKYDKININEPSKYKIMDNIKKKYDLNSTKELRDHWINYGEVHDTFESLD